MLPANKLMEESNELEERRLALSLASWVTTPPDIVKKMLQMAQVGPEDMIYDLGCGDARILIIAVEEFGAKRAVGYELREELYQASLQEIKWRNLQDKVVLIKGNLLEADLSEASVVTLFLSDKANELLRPKLEKELRCGTRIVSLTFKTDTWRMSDLTYGRPPPYFPMYLYVIPEAFK